MIFAMWNLISGDVNSISPESQIDLRPIISFTKILACAFLEALQHRQDERQQWQLRYSAPAYADLPDTRKPIKKPVIEEEKNSLSDRTHNFFIDSV